MLIFLNTEFTDFAHPELISIGLVCEHGQTFYAQRNDFQRHRCSTFVRSEVLLLLARVPDATFSKKDLTLYLRAWFDALPEPATVVFDHFGDWLELNGALRGHAHGSLPKNLGQPMQLFSSVFEHPVFKQASEAAFSSESPQHHALADALPYGLALWPGDQ